MMNFGESGIKCRTLVHITHTYIHIHMYLYVHTSDKSNDSKCTCCHVLCHSQDPALWACLAGMATSARDLNTAEIAYAAIDEVRYTLID